VPETSGNKAGFSSFGAVDESSGRGSCSRHPYPWLRREEEKYWNIGGTCSKHCSTEFMKHVLPKFISPPNLARERLAECREAMRSL
jgi:hypothetical protein